ncbi:MAG: hypothetical protein IH591_13400, partial [Bacteroidales bacterium]|nr:hypothetical protein [Bacteroidales bacterium]
TQQNGIYVKWGELTLKELNLEIDFTPDEVKMSVNGNNWPCRFEAKTGSLSVLFEEVCLSPGNDMIIQIL